MAGTPTRVRPDWVCEVLSPSSRSRDTVYKRNLYAECEIPYYWLIDPDVRTLEAFELVAGRWTLIGTYDEAAMVRIAPFEAIELAIGRLFLPRTEREASEASPQD